MGWSMLPIGTIGVGKTLVSFHTEVFKEGKRTDEIENT